MAKKLKKSESIKLTAKKAIELRSNHLKLLATNPNFFGNLPDIGIAPDLVFPSNKNYEEIKCIGYNPQTSTLYATIVIKNQTGYSGNLCQRGSFEHVRFYVDWNGDGDFNDNAEDVGVASVNVHDIPNANQLHYTLAVKTKAFSYFCSSPRLPRVRAVLSWGSIPPANTPNWRPVWGEVQTTHIQAATWKFTITNDLIATTELAPIDIPTNLLSTLTLDQVVNAPKALTIKELAQVYANEDVKASRFAMPAIQNFQAAALYNTISLPTYLEGLGIGQVDIGDLDIVFVPKGNTNYEELHCVGLDYEREMITAILSIKRPAGYSGNACGKGSQEYVSFWADFNDNGTWESPLGTTAVRVHDFGNIPGKGLYYAVELPLRGDRWRRLCQNPRVFKLRATLSWNKPVTGPSQVPVFGNTVDAYVQMKPGLRIGTQEPIISAIGNMPVAQINASGFANGQAILSGFTANQSPFGGVVTIAGRIANAPNLSSFGVQPLKYQISYRNLNGGTWTALNNAFDIALSRWNGLSWTQQRVRQVADNENFYTYREDTNSSDVVVQFVEGSLLARWNTNGLADGLYDLRMTAKRSDGTIVGNSIDRVRIDNTRPEAAIKITGFRAGVGAPIQPANDCGFFQVGQIVVGEFTGTDTHYALSTLRTLPSSLSPPSPNPNSDLWSGVLADNGTVGQPWELDLTGFKPCGYVAQLSVIDRTIVNSGQIGYRTHAEVGFCVMLG